MLATRRSGGRPEPSFAPPELHTTSHLAFPLIGLASLVIGWPLARGRVPPNRWYGVRAPSTLSTSAIWYETNAVCGDELVRMGLVLLVVGIALRFVRGLPELGYVVICLAVFVAGSVRATVRSLRLANRLSKTRLEEHSGAA